MNRFPETNALHPEWETPKDGDFAGYVERLTAVRAAQFPEESGRVLHVAESMQRFKPRVANVADTDLPNLQGLKTPLAGMLNFVQLGLVLLVVVQVAVLVLAGLGSAAGVAAAVLGWWVVGRWKRALGAARPQSAPVTSPLLALQQQLQALAQQKSKTVPSE